MKRTSRFPWMREDFWETHFWRKAIISMLLAGCLWAALILVYVFVPFFSETVWLMNLSLVTGLGVLILPLYLDKKRPKKEGEIDSLLGFALLGLNLICLFLGTAIVGILFGLILLLFPGAQIDPDLINFHP